jgi:hypothetical protein
MAQLRLEVPSPQKEKKVVGEVLYNIILTNNGTLIENNL